MKEKLKYLTPFAVVLFSILTLLANNAGIVQPGAAIRSILVSLVLTLCVILLLRVLLRDWEKAALLAAVIVLIVFSYGHLYHALRESLPRGLEIIRHRYLIPLLILVIGACLLWMQRQSGRLRSILTTSTIVVGLMMVYPLGVILFSEWRDYTVRSEQTDLSPGDCELAPPDGEIPPDIYYIILDGYTRDDVLLEAYGYDNRPFLNELEKRGFYVARGSQSNYARTGLSLTSSLNFDYLDLTEQAGHSEGSVPFSPAAIPNNRVRRELACAGYKIIAFDSGTYWSGWRNADYFLSPTGSGDAKYIVALGTGLNPFESMLMNTSIGLILADSLSLLSNQARAAFDHPFQEHRERILFALEEAGGSAPFLPSPKFVFVHIINPHVPFVFGPNGEPITGSGPFTLLDTKDTSEEESIIGYRDQVHFLNSQVIPMVDAILENSKTPPVIILQGDHGIGDVMKNKMSILNAYYLPGGGDEGLYPTISPVNTFRVVFNEYFGEQYGLLEDKSFYSTGKIFDLAPYPNPLLEPAE